MNGEPTQGNTPQQVSPTPEPSPSQPTPPSEDSFFSKHSKAITRLVIVLIIIVGAAIYSRTQNQELVNVPDDQDVESAAEQEGEDEFFTLDSEDEDDEDNEEDEDNVSVTVDESQKQAPDVMVTEEIPETMIKVSGEEITVVVQRGNGYTHLARRALAEYLDTTGEQGIIAEHKIFIEDYLQKKITDRQKLQAGDEVGFAQNQIQEAIDASLDLTEAQVNNLSQYVPLVPSLN